MSIESLVAEINEFDENDEYTELDEINAIEAEVAPTVVGWPSATVPPVRPPARAQKKRGRPAIHSKSGRAGFFPSEIEEIRRDPQTFLKWMQTTYAVSDERRVVFTKNNIDCNPTTAITYTIEGAILAVIEQAENICLANAGKSITWRMTKQKLVTGTSAAYEAPRCREVKVGNRATQAIEWQEFSPDHIKVYLEIK